MTQNRPGSYRKWMDGCWLTTLSLTCEFLCRITGMQSLLGIDVWMDGCMDFYIVGVIKMHPKPTELLFASCCCSVFSFLVYVWCPLDNMQSGTSGAITSYFCKSDCCEILFLQQYVFGQNGKKLQRATKS